MLETPPKSRVKPNNCPVTLTSSQSRLITFYSGLELDLNTTLSVINKGFSILSLCTSMV